MKNGLLALAVAGELTRIIYRLVIAGLVIVGLIVLVVSCANNASLNEHSSCQQFAQADSSTQDKVLQDMMNAHNDHESIQLARASLNLYCDVYGGSAPIDGIYGGGDVAPQSGQALHAVKPAIAA